MIVSLMLTGCIKHEETEPLTTAQETAVSKDYSSAVISFLGPEGTYTQDACGVFFDKQGIYRPYTTVSEAVSALVNGESDYAVIPQENTIGGAVVDYVDTLIAEDKVSVVGEVILPINQNLLVLPGAKLEGIKTVYSHKQGITQGREWLKEKLPDAEVIEVSSTAEGAKMVSEGNDPSCAAIAAAACADVYGLEILAAGIQNNESNKTRFYVLSMEEPSVSGSDYMAFIASGPANGFPGLMADLERIGMELVTIHERPEKTELGNYHYLIECSGGSYKEYMELEQNSSFVFRYLGSFQSR